MNVNRIAHEAARTPIVLLAVALLGASGCAMFTPPHSTEHYQCRRSCTSQHDACIVESMSGPALQYCDQQLPPCLASCPY
jgi:hypothetical protein